MSIDVSEVRILDWTRVLIALALIQQAAEMIGLRRKLGPQWVWPWRLVRQDFSFFPSPVIRGFDWLFQDSVFMGVILLQLVLSLVLLLTPILPLFILLLVTHTLICLRWRGTFNGGSDFMTLVILVALSLVAGLGQNAGALNLALGYIALQSVASYWIAGISKISKPTWRSGQALRVFLDSTGLQHLGEVWIRLATAVILIFECTFPLAILSSRVCVVYLVMALLFHLGNARVLGLNRFLLPWAATYPAIFYLSQFKILGIGS